MRAARGLAVVLVAVLALSACGSGHGGSDDEAQITSAYQKFFSGKTSVSDRIALLQNGNEFKALVASFAANPLARNVTAEVSSVELEGSDKAKVTYTIKFGGSALPEQTGSAVKENGTWKVGSASLCKLVALGGTTPAICKTS